MKQQWKPFAGIAELRRDPEGQGYEVVDSRTGEVLAWRGMAASAGQIVDEINVTYPELAPSHEALVHEIVGWRIAGVAG